MASLCAEHHHHHHGHMRYHNLLSPKKSLGDLNVNIPPRKLISRRVSDVDNYFPSETLFQKYLPCNGENSSGSGSDDGFDPDSDPYSSDQFRMYEFKVRKCTRSRSHDWTDCPFSHPGEKARRRDPRRFHYSGTVCPEYRRSGGCTKGDECEFAHGVFECWLHPGRYRTEACKDGKSCKRKVCFFAHTPRELRLLPVSSHDEDGEEIKEHQHQQQNNNCCKYCCAISPTSTLMGMSHFSSPPLSPMKEVGVGSRGLSRYADRVNSLGSDEVAFMMNSLNKGGMGSGMGMGGMRYDDMLLAELLGSMEGMNLGAESVESPNKGPGLWVDVGGYENVNRSPNQMMQFSFSPSTTPVDPPASSYSSSSRSFFSSNNNGDSEASPDLGWVNELLT